MKLVTVFFVLTTFPVGRAQTFVKNIAQLWPENQPFFGAVEILSIFFFPESEGGCETTRFGDFTCCFK